MKSRTDQERNRAALRVLCAADQREHDGGVSAPTAGAGSGFLGGTDRCESRGKLSGSTSGAHPRAHCGRSSQEVPSSDASEWANFAVDSEQELLESAMARAREEEERVAPGDAAR